MSRNSPPTPSPNTRPTARSRRWPARPIFRAARTGWAPRPISAIPGRSPPTGRAMYLSATRAISPFAKSLPADASAPAPARPATPATSTALAATPVLATLTAWPSISPATSLSPTPPTTPSAKSRPPAKPPLSPPTFQIRKASPSIPAASSISRTRTASTEFRRMGRSPACRPCR